MNLAIFDTAADTDAVDDADPDPADDTQAEKNQEKKTGFRRIRSDIE